MKSQKKSLLLPKRNLIFKKLFGEQKNIWILQSFLLSVLELPKEKVESVQFVNPELLPEEVKGKSGIVDVLVKTVSGEIIHVEMQVEVFEHMRERMVWYNAGLVYRQLKKGQGYENINQCISILITDFVEFKESPDYEHRFSIADLQRGIELSDVSLIYTLEMPKVQEGMDHSKKSKWLQFLRAEAEEDFEMLAAADEDLNKAYEELQRISDDDQIRYLYERAEIEEKDRKARELYVQRRADAVRAEGEAMIEEGKGMVEEEKGMIEEGKVMIEEAKVMTEEAKVMMKEAEVTVVETAKNLFGLGFTYEQILTTIPNLTEEMTQRIREELF